MYSLVLSLRARPQLRQLDAAHAFVMGALSGALQALLGDVRYQGTCDLTWGDRKFSGNSLRVTRDSMLYHGTLLYAADLERIARCLKMPPRRPDYRRDRQHHQFLTNLPLSRAALEAAVIQAFDVSRQLREPPTARAAELCQSRYNNPQWNFRH
jgi:lipoate-protein ligase A